MLILAVAVMAATLVYAAVSRRNPVTPIAPMQRMR